MTDLAPTNPRRLSKFRVLGDKVIVKEVDPAEKIGRIILPESVRARIKKDDRLGIVHKVGPGWVDGRGVLHPTTVKPGDKVIFTGQGTREMPFEEGTFLGMHEGLIMLALEDDDPAETAAQ